MAFTSVLFITLFTSRDRLRLDGGWFAHHEAAESAYMRGSFETTVIFVLFSLAVRATRTALAFFEKCATSRLELILAYS
jgi:hypothetical protein